MNRTSSGACARLSKAVGNRERAIRNVCRLYTVNRFDALPGAIRTAMLALLDETVRLSDDGYLTTGPPASGRVS